MPISIAQLKENRRTITIDFQGEKIGVIYKPSEFTPELENELSLIKDEQLVGKFLVTVLSRMVDSWEVIDDAGNEYKPTVDNLNKLQDDFLAAVLYGIGEDNRVARDERKN